MAPTAGVLTSCLVMVLSTCLPSEARVVGVPGGAGDPCAFPDGAMGRCEELRSCLADGGTVRRARQVVRCLGEQRAPGLQVCCRKPRAVARKLCQSWSPYWRSASTVGNVTCLAEHSLIHGGEETGLGQYPNMAAVGAHVGADAIKWDCGGSLVTPSYVMTAAHCVKDLKQRPVVGLGEHDLSITNDRGRTRRLSQPSGHLDGPNVDDGNIDQTTPIVQIIEVDKDYVHPDYQKFYHDIALLHLQRPAILTARVLPSCLPFSSNTDDFDSTTQFVVTGWGSMDYGSNPEAADGSRRLQHARLEYMDSTHCTIRFSRHPAVQYPPPWGITSDVICAGAANRDSCRGDSGGPLILDTPGVRDTECAPVMTVGVVSFGPPCNNLGAYTRVISYLDWITGIVAPQVV